MDRFDYILAWSVYLIAAVPLCFVTWRVLKKFLWRDFAFLCQGFLFAIIFTPWYVLSDQEILAPAIIIFMMDSITLGSEEGIRALIPLVMAMLLAVFLTIIVSIAYRLKNRKARRKPVK